MAKVKGYPGKPDVPAVTEDPRTENGGWFFYGDRHDKDSLSPIFDSSINFGPDGATYGSHGTSASAQPQQRYRLGALQLSKQTTSVGLASTASSGSGDYRYDNNAMWSMDPAYQDGGACWKITNGTFTTVLTAMSNGSTLHMRGWSNLATSTNLSDVGPTSIQSFIGGPMHLAGTPMNGIVPGFGSMDANDYFYPAYQWIGIGNSWPSSYTTYNTSATNLGSYVNVQFLGLSQVDQAPLYVTTMKGGTTEGVRVQVQRVQWTTTTPTVTQMFTNTTVPAASGTSVGGNNMNNKIRDKFCSNWFVDPRDVSGNTRCFYFPYFDTNQNYHPFVITWNKTTDVFARETDITVATGGLSNTDQLADISSLVSDQPTHTTSFTYNETFVSGGTRYLTVMHFDTREQYPNTTGPRMFVTYSVNATNPKQLTFHSKVVIPKTPRNLVWLNDAHTMVGIFMVNQFNIYTFNASTGWTLTTTIGEFVYNCGRDSQDRIWYTTNSARFGGASGTGFMDTHVLTPSLPVSITITPETTSYEYAGTPLNSFVNVSAINAAGVRIATSVKLVIQGGSMTFADNSIVKTVTTLTTGALQVDTIITGAGFTNIIASVEV